MLHSMVDSSLTNMQPYSQTMLQKTVFKAQSKMQPHSLDWIGTCNFQKNGIDHEFLKI